MGVSKKGFTLIEAIASTVILILFATAFLTTVLFSITQMSLAKARTEALTEANTIVSSAIRGITNGTVSVEGLEVLTGAQYKSTGFNYDANNTKQFVLTTTINNSITEYKITAAVYYGSKGENITLSGTAVNTGVNFEG